MDVLKYMLGKLSDEVNEAENYYKYYNGDHPLVYSTARLREIFNNTTLVTYIQNWCAVVVDASLDRLSFQGWDSSSETVNSILDNYYRAENLPAVSKAVHKDALVTGNGYLIFDDIGGAVRVFRNDPLNVTCLYDDEDPTQMKVALKTWLETDWEETGSKATRANLYYPDRIEKYVSMGGHGQNYVLFEELPNRFGKIPVVHFQPYVLELQNVITLQDAINKTFCDMMVTGEFNAFKQRWIITNSDLAELRASPQTLWHIPAGGSDEESTRLGEFSASDLNMFLEVMNQLSNSIAIISRTPKHYFLSSGANISGEALTVMESPLVKKVEQHITLFSRKWEEVAHFIVSEDSDVQTTWGTITTEIPGVVESAMKSLIDLGVPLKTVLQRFGWSEQEITMMDDERRQERLEQAELTREALAMAELRFQRESNPLGE